MVYYYVMQVTWKVTDTVMEHYHDKGLLGWLDGGLAPPRPRIILDKQPGSFPMSWLFGSGGQSTGASASASVLPINIQGCNRPHSTYTQYASSASWDLLKEGATTFNSPP